MIFFSVEIYDDNLRATDFTKKIVKTFLATVVPQIKKKK